jgi:alpha-amylase
LTRQHPDNAEWQKLVRFTRGGYWRNFRTRYSESHEMYARMIGISNRLARLAASEDSDPQRRDLLQAARTHLHRGQCNCSYWHGAFGGLYLPHLRNAVYAELIRADNLLEQSVRGDSAWVDVEVGDLNMDARPEVRLSNQKLSATFAPACGGHMYELDLRTNAVNLLATLNRRPEPYHQRILDYVANAGNVSGEELASISRDVRFRQPDLDRRIQYDHWPRKSFVDHFLRPRLTLPEFRRNEGVIGDFAVGEWEAGVRKGERRILLELERAGQAGGLSGRVRKTVAISADRPSELLVQYELTGFPAGMPLHFAVELNFAAMPGGAADRYFYDDQGTRIGTLDTVQDLQSAERLSLVDEWLGLDVSLESSVKTGFWAYPLETISQSEDGFEAIHQSVCVIPHWEFLMPESGRWVVELRLVPDTAMALARQLAESARRRRDELGTESAVSVSSGFPGRGTS